MVIIYAGGAILNVGWVAAAEGGCKPMHWPLRRTETGRHNECKNGTLASIIPSTVLDGLLFFRQILVRRHVIFATCGICQTSTRFNTRRFSSSLRSCNDRSADQSAARSSCTRTAPKDVISLVKAFTAVSGNLAARRRALRPST